MTSRIVRADEVHVTCRRGLVEVRLFAGGKEVLVMGAVPPLKLSDFEAGSELVVGGLEVVTKEMDE